MSIFPLLDMIANEGSRPTKYRQIFKLKKKKQDPTLKRKLCVTSDEQKDLSRENI